MAQVTGRVTVKRNGLVILSRSGASINTGGPVRTAVISDQGDIDHSVAIEQATITVPAIHRADVDMIAIRNDENVTVSFEADSGATWVVNGAWANVSEMSNGEFTVTYEGRPATRVP